MKTLLSLALGTALTLAALAIPQTFNNGGGFFNAAGMNLEDFAGQVAAFQPDTKLPGKWAPVPGKKDTVRLELDAVVFGLKASEITAQKSDHAVVKYSVVFRADRQRAQTHGQLQDRLVAAINAYTGKSITFKDPVEYKGVRFTMALAGNGDVRVDFTRAS